MTVEWPTVPLEPKVATIVRGVTYSRNDASSEPTEGRLPLLRAGNIGNGDLDVERDLIWIPAEVVSQKQKLQPNDIVVCTSSGSPAVVGKAAILREEFCGTFDAFNAVVRAHNPVTAKFLHYWFQSPAYYSWRDSQAKGANIQNIRHSELAALRVPLPAHSEQRRIVDLFDQADYLRRLRAKANTKADRILPALFLNLFGDPTKNLNKLPLVELGEVTTDGPQNGIYKPATDYGDGTRILRIDSFYDGQIVDVNSLKRLKVTPAEVQKYGLRQWDIVINRVSSPEYLGKSTIVRSLAEPLVFESNMMRCSIDPSVMLPEFVIAHLQTQFTRTQILSKAKRAVNQASINQQDVRSLTFLRPPIRDQETFVAAARECLKLKRRTRGASKATNALIYCVLQRAFSGELSAAWRDVHQAELSEELAQQAKALAGAS